MNKSTNKNTQFSHKVSVRRLSLEEYLHLQGIKSALHFTSNTFADVTSKSLYMFRFSNCLMSVNCAYLLKS